jgi:hypothetical protein
MVNASMTNVYIQMQELTERNHMKNDRAEKWGTIAIILFTLGTCVVSLAITAFMYYAIFHFIVKFW